MPNQLAGEKSPYLLQHADNPVDWYPWGEEAFRRARRENKPLLISIGYAACHWCHVMEHESFEDAATAELMNRSFVNVKVDREERPDVDGIYMEAVQLLTGQGGWPLNVFVLPDGRPFWGGTYFPPDTGRGMPSWKQVLTSISDAFSARSHEIGQTADTLTDAIRQTQGVAGGHGELRDDLVPMAVANLMQSADAHNGGFGSAPKFPQPLALDLLLRAWNRGDNPQARDTALFTLDRMAAGGIHDQIGGGFHRYTVDATWTVPHFEKMLYDNALLALVYTHAWQVTHEDRYAEVARATCDYILRDLASPEGGFYASQDADSEGGEGAYYVWTPAELEAVLGEDAGLAALRYGVTARGNFEGSTILTQSASMNEIAATTGQSLDSVRTRMVSIDDRLLRARSHRPAPGTDTKIVLAWNAFAIRALAETGRALQNERYLAAAIRAAEFVWSSMRPNGALVRTFKDGPSTVNAFLEDFGSLIEAYLSLYAATGDRRWFERSNHLAQDMVALFYDAESHLLFDVQLGVDDLVVRPRGMFDNPTPSGNSAACHALLHLEALTGDSAHRPVVTAVLSSMAALYARAPGALAYLLAAVDMAQRPPLQLAVVGDGDRAALDALMRPVWDRYLPNRALAITTDPGNPADPPLLAGRNLQKGMPTAYVCEHFACRLPVTRPQDLEAQLKAYA